MTISLAQFLSFLPIIISLLGLLIGFRQIGKKADGDATASEISLLKTQLGLIQTACKECHDSLARAEAERDQYMRESQASQRELLEYMRRWSGQADRRRADPLP